MQYARPIADILVGSWGTTPLWDKLDEVAPDDATTQVQSANRPTNDTFEVRLSSVTDPQSSSGHVVRIRMYGNTSHTWSAYLYQGATLIKTLVSGAVPPSSYITNSYMLTAGEADSITNYADLRVRIVANGSANGREYVTWIELEVPNLLIAKSGTATVSGRGNTIGIVKKAALVLALAGILGHVLAAGFKAHPANIHGGGAIAVTAGKSAMGGSVLSGGWNESQSAPETHDDFERPTENPILPPWCAIKAAGGDYPINGNPMLQNVGSGTFTSDGDNKGAAYNANGPVSFDQWVETYWSSASTYPPFFILRYDPATKIGLFAEWGRYTINVFEWVDGTRYNLQSFTPGRDYVASGYGYMRCEVVGRTFRVLWNGFVECEATLGLQYANKPGYTGVGVTRGWGGWRYVPDYRSARIPSGARGKKGASNQLYVITGMDEFQQAAGSILGDDPNWSDGGSARIKDGGAYCEVFGTSENTFLGGAVPASNEFVQATIIGEGDNAFAGLTLRGGQYKFWFRVQFGDVVSWRDSTWLGSVGGNPVQVGDTVSVDAKGDTFFLKVNGSVVMTVTDSTYPPGGSGGILLQGPSSGVHGVPVQLDRFVVGYNYGFTIRGGGNLYVWSEDHEGALAISGDGAVAVAGRRGAAVLLIDDIFTDNFNRANEDPILSPWWEPTHWVHTGKIISNELQVQYWYGAGVFFTGGPASADCKVSATLKSLPWTEQKFGLVGRAEIAGNGVTYILVEFGQFPDSVGVYRYAKSAGGDGTTRTTILSPVSLPSALVAGQRLLAVFAGNVVSVYVDGAICATADLGSTAPGVGGLGVYSAGLNTAVRFDDFQFNATRANIIRGNGSVSVQGKKGALYSLSPIVIAQDNFNRGNTGPGDLGSNWYANGSYINSQQVRSAYPGDNVSYWTGVGAFGDDQVCEITWPDVSTGDAVKSGPAVRVQGVGGSRRYCFIGSMSGLKSYAGIYAFSPGMYILGGFVDTSWIPAGAKIRLSVAGNVLNLYVNGVLWITRTDANNRVPSGGVAGFYMGATAAVIDNFIAYGPTPAFTVVGGGRINATERKGISTVIVVHGGGYVNASAREDARYPASISGRGTVTLAGRKTGRRGLAIHGNGAPTAGGRKVAKCQFVIVGGGDLYGTGSSLFVDTASVAALIHGGGELHAEGRSWRGGPAWVFGGGRVTVYFDRAWPYLPVNMIENPDSICYLVMIEMPYCSRTFGTSPCLATGTPCYNTWRTCTYIQAYSPTTKVYRYLSAEYPKALPLARPYISDLKFMPTEIKTNLTVNARMSFTMIDEPDADVETDPYWLQRSSHPGTYWKRWLARNANYKGRIVRVYEGVYGRSESTYVQRWVGKLDNIQIRGEKFTFEAVDLLKDLAKIEVPPKTNAKLALELRASDNASFVVTEDADKFPSSGYVRIGDEIIRYASVNVATKTFTIGGGANRGLFGTAAATHAVKDKVQGARYYAPKNPLEILLDMLLGDAGMKESWVATDNVNNVNVGFTTTATYVELGVAVSQSWPSVGILRLENWPTPGVAEFVRYTSKTYVPGGVGVSPAWRFNFERYDGVMTGRGLFGTSPISGGVNSIRAERGFFEHVDLDAFYQYRDWPLRDINFTTIVSEPTKLSDLYMEIVDLLDAKSWVAENLKITIRKNTTNTPTTGYISLTDEAHIALESGDVDVNEKSRVSRVSIYWDKTATGKFTDEMSYRRLDLAIDPDAETNYGGSEEKAIKSRWIDPYVTLEETVQAFVKNLAIRRVQRQKHAQHLITIRTAEKDSNVKTGDYVRLSTDELNEASGLPITSRMYQVVKRERKKNEIELQLLQVTSRRMATIAPAGLPAYPLATETQRAYGYICDAFGRMSDGTEGYFIW
jgi:hypothetical protein